MELYLQFGHGMMAHSRSLLAAWDGGTVILSPRDLDPAQLQRLAGEIIDIEGGSVLLDPQFYLPHADHERLRSHDYWPGEYESGGFWSGPDLRNLVNQLYELNQSLGCQEFILPGTLASSVDDDWIDRQASVIEEAVAIDSNVPLISTVALSSDVGKLQDQIHELLEASTKWDTAGFYLVCEHPNGDYLIRDPNWLANVLDLSAGLRLQHRKVILGYCTHQMLIAALAGVDAIASGTWMNVRSFPPEKFVLAYQEEIKQRSTWYYCPQTLSEYKLPFLDIAFRQRVLPSMAPSPDFDDQYVSILFQGSQPTTVGLSEQAAFRHYLQSLQHQVFESQNSSFEETVNHHEQLLAAAESLLQQLRRNGVFGQLRDFCEIVDVNRSAMAAFISTRGPVMHHQWGNLVT